MISDIFRDSVYYFVSKLLIAILNLSVIYVILRYYGAEIYGDFSIVFLTAMTVSNISTTWLTQSYLRKANNLNSNSDIVISSLFIIFSFTLIINAFVLNLFVDIGISLLVVSFLSISQSLYALGRSILQKNRQIKLFFLLDLLRILFIFIVAVALLSENKSVESLVYSYIIANLVFFMALKDLKLSIKLDIKLAIKIREWVRFGFPVAVWLTIASSQLLIDRYILKQQVSLEISGLYSAYYDLILKSCSLIIIPISNALYPILVENESDINSYKKLSIWLSLSSLIISSIISALSYFIYPYFNEYFSFSFSSANISLLIFGIVLWQLGLIYQKPIEMQNNTLKMVLNIFVCLCISTSANYYFVNSYGVDIFPLTLSLSAILYLFLTYISVTK